jgi:hypothetical protein
VSNSPPLTHERIAEKGEQPKKTHAPETFLKSADCPSKMDETLNRAMTMFSTCPQKSVDNPLAPQRRANIAKIREFASCLRFFSDEEKDKNNALQALRSRLNCIQCKNPCRF